MPFYCRCWKCTCTGSQLAKSAELLKLQRFSHDDGGLVRALGSYFQGVVLQRCQAHFIRNFMSKLTRRDAKSDLPCSKIFPLHQ